jgi:hypothetical protein
MVEDKGMRSEDFLFYSFLLLLPLSPVYLLIPFFLFFFVFFVALW